MFIRRMNLSSSGQEYNKMGRSKKKLLNHFTPHNAVENVKSSGQGKDDWITSLMVALLRRVRGMNGTWPLFWLEKD
jgi:hypothetical protein